MWEPLDFYYSEVKIHRVSWDSWYVKSVWQVCLVHVTIHYLVFSKESALPASLADANRWSSEWTPKSFLNPTTTCTHPRQASGFISEWEPTRLLNATTNNTSLQKKKGGSKLWSIFLITLYMMMHVESTLKQEAHEIYKILCNFSRGQHVKLCIFWPLSQPIYVSK